MIFVLGALTAIGPMSIDAYLPALPQLGDEFDVSRASAQLSLTACLIGFALGQLVAGPLSDTLGRRLPMVLGAAGYAVASLACAAAPDLTAFVLLRFVQGFAGATGVVVARAVIRDVATGKQAVRYFSQLATTNALAPVLAPLLGAGILLIATWRGVFVALACFGALLAVALLARFRETLPHDARSSAAPRAAALAFRAVLVNRSFVGYLLLGALGATVLFSYLSGSSYVIQEEFGASPTLYAASFALNGLGLALFAQLNARVAPRWGSDRMLHLAFQVQSTAAAGLVLVALFAPRDISSLPLVMAAFFGMVAPMGMVGPNYVARAMGSVSANAGTASAALGATTFLAGGLVGPLTGLGDSVVTVGLLALAGAIGGVVLSGVLHRRSLRQRQAPLPAALDGA